MLRKRKANISLAEPYNCLYINMNTIALYNKARGMFYDDRCLKAVSGFVSSSVWSSFRSDRILPLKAVQKTADLYNKSGLAFDFVFDNEFILEADLSDTYSNLMLKSAHYERNTVTLKSPLLADYIKENYPLYKIKMIAGPDKFNEQNIVIDCFFNNKKELKNVKYKQNADIILNPVCPCDCKYYDIHQKYLMKEQKGFYSPSNHFVCPLANNYNFYTSQKNKEFITVKQMNKYLSQGFENFKIDYPNALRNTHIAYNNYDIIESYIYYLIKPQYQNQARKKLVMSFMTEERRIREDKL